jgi:16S rRNA A1518/A1519 N6-dimethyltransferase RsmA/KsgA/DIM1 with predicted DNA glycosylase/AP lyase activity
MYFHLKYHHLQLRKRKNKKDKDQKGIEKIIGKKSSRRKKFIYKNLRNSLNKINDSFKMKIDPNLQKTSISIITNIIASHDSFKIKMMIIIKDQ